MQSELEAEYPDLDVQLLGVNAWGQEFGVPNATQDRHIPMLQDVDVDSDGAGDVWTSWDVEWRDVVILDANNNKVGVYNLTPHDLAEPENYATLKTMLLDAVQFEQPAGSIAGYSYFDVDDDGVMDAAELPVSGVEIVLTGNSADGTAVNRSVVTGADGSYIFQGLSAGTYTVSQTQPQLTVNGRETIGTLGGSAEDNAFHVTLEAGTQAEDYNFGELGRDAHSISLVDFLASTPRDGMLVALTAGQGPEWFVLEGAWKTYHSAEVSVESDATVSVSLQDTAGDTWAGHYGMSDSWQVRRLGENNGTPLLRIKGLLASITSPPETSLLLNVPEAEGEAPAIWPSQPLDASAATWLPTEPLVAADTTGGAAAALLLPSTTGIPLPQTADNGLAVLFADGLAESDSGPLVLPVATGASGLLAPTDADPDVTVVAEDARPLLDNDGIDAALADGLLLE